MSEPAILVERRDQFVAVVTLNRPEVFNALDSQGWIDLGQAFVDLSADDALRCVILRGAGGKAFCTGADISEFETVRRNSTEAADYGQIVQTAWRAILNCPIPVVARIAGLCVGGGLETACHADIRIGSHDSRYGIPVKRLGLVLAPAELDPVASLIGPSRAGDLLFRGRLVDSATAENWGLVNSVARDGELDQMVETVVGEIVEGAPLVARWHKSFLARYRQPATFSAEDFRAGYACYDTEDFKIGYRSFLEKKKPEFVGK